LISQPSDLESAQNSRPNIATMSETGQIPAVWQGWHPGDGPWQHAGEHRWQARRSTPLVPSAFLNDHGSDEDSFLLLPFGAIQDRTISNISIFEENYFFEWW